MTGRVSSAFAVSAVSVWIEVTRVGQNEYRSEYTVNMTYMHTFDRKQRINRNLLVLYAGAVIVSVCFTFDGSVWNFGTLQR